MEGLEPSWGTALEGRERGRGETGGHTHADEMGWCTGADRGPSCAGIRCPRARQESTKVRGETRCPQVGEGVNEGDLEACGAREKSAVKRVCRNEAGLSGQCKVRGERVREAVPGRLWGDPRRWRGDWGDTGALEGRGMLLGAWGTP